MQPASFADMMSCMMAILTAQGLPMIAIYSIQDIKQPTIMFNNSIVSNKDMKLS
jgi:hypothetical protein